ncbi:arabinose ABC transporter substrate-binding protein, partial [Pseudomonas sp. MH9.3]|nr:arabinose ABC transporter substrate-binding protein [Pseudomonas sp. MH9.3]
MLVKNRLKKTLGAVAFALAFSGTVCAEEVKIGFLVKQAEEPWFQTEWAFA